MATIRQEIERESITNSVDGETKDAEPFAEGRFSGKQEETGRKTLRSVFPPAWERTLKKEGDIYPRTPGCRKETGVAH